MIDPDNGSTATACPDRPKTRQADCTRCGERIYRVRSSRPMCDDCRTDSRIESRSSVTTTQNRSMANYCPAVRHRARLLARVVQSTCRAIRAALDSWVVRAGRKPTPREYRHIETAVLSARKRRGVPVGVSCLPPAGDTTALIRLVIAMDAEDTEYGGSVAECDLGPVPEDIYRPVTR